MQLTELELKMYEKGYVSPRMVAKKVLNHPATVERLIREGTLDSVTVGGRKFIPIEGVLEWQGPDAVDLLDLNDWSDIINGKKSKK